MTRHRAERAAAHRKLRRSAAAVLFVAAAGLGMSGWATPASADSPVQTGWWNGASGGGSAAPQPNTPPGGLHIAVAPGQVVAFGAVLYALPPGGAGTLELKIADSQAGPAVNPNAPSTSPSMPIQACPTTSTWKGGDDQPFSAAPKYDCSKHSFLGNPSSDNKTMTFLVDASAETVPGQLSLAIVPVMTDAAPDGTPLPADTTQPFSADIAKPDATSLLVTSAPPPAPSGDRLGSGPAPAPAGGSTAGAGSTNVSGSGAAAGGGVPAPPMLTGAGNGTTTATDPGTSPVVAPANPTATTPVTPTAAALPTKSSTAHDAALAMLVLLGLAILGSGNAAVQRAPRLLGGAGRHAARSGADPSPPPAPGAQLVDGQWMVPAGGMGVRGLGRFAVPRTTPPRPLV